MPLALWVLLGVFAAIAAGRIGSVSIAPWQAMSCGAVLVLLGGAITPYAAWLAIDSEVMLFLAGMFLVGRALITSGYLYHAAFLLFRHAASVDVLLIMVLLSAGIASALLMNDTIALVGPALVIRLAQHHHLNPTPLLLALAFSVTIGSVPSPIGNPQNLLIAVQGHIDAPFLTFANYLGMPTLFNLFLAWLWLRWRYRSELHRMALRHQRDKLRDPKLARLCQVALLLIGLLILLKTAQVALALPWHLPLSFIALGGALPLVIASPQRVELLRRLDWSLLAFFAALFVLMAAVWQTGAAKAGLIQLGLNLDAAPTLLWLGLLASQIISNVPLVALLLPLIPSHDPIALMALAAGSTIAGNLLLLGAASNIIVVQQAARHGVHLDFFTFARAGIPLALMNALVYGAWLIW